jgi:hypothetical protein
MTFKTKDAKKTVPMVLTGDENTPDMPLTDGQVNHLRRLLAWMRLEYMLDEDMQRGFLESATMFVDKGIGSPEQLSEIVQEKAEKINHVPIYLRQGIKMLTKALHEHDKKSGILDSATTP